jgi:hypothetical protein
LVGKGRKNSSPQVAKVGKYRERMESLEEWRIPNFSAVGKSRNF